MMHRIRYMVSQFNEPYDVDRFSQMDGVVEADEMYLGGKPKKGDARMDKNGKRRRKCGRGTSKTPIFGLLERGGRVRAFVVPDTKRKTVHPIFKRYVKQGSTVITDEYKVYENLSERYDHHSVNHSAKEYSRDGKHINPMEGFWGLVKRGYVGTYHWISPHHTTLYLDEFSFRYHWHLHSDSKKFNELVKKCEGVLRYKDLVGATYYKDFYELWLGIYYNPHEKPVNPLFKRKR
jgi:transposase-like protein